MPTRSTQDGDELGLDRQQFLTECCTCPGYVAADPRVCWPLSTARRHGHSKRERVRECNTKVAVLLHSLQLGPSHEVGMRLAVALSADVHHVALFWVEVHLPALSPFLQGVDVGLEDVTVSWGRDGAIDDTVVCKESSDCARGEVIGDVIYVNQKHEGAKDCSLRDARVKSVPGRGGTVDKDTLSSTY